MDVGRLCTYQRRHNDMKITAIRPMFRTELKQEDQAMHNCLFSREDDGDWCRMVAHKLNNSNIRALFFARLYSDGSIVSHCTLISSGTAISKENYWQRYHYLPPCGRIYENKKPVELCTCTMYYTRQQIQHNSVIVLRYKQKGRCGSK